MLSTGATHNGRMDDTLLVELLSCFSCGLSSFSQVCLQYMVCTTYPHMISYDLIWPCPSMVYPKHPHDSWFPHHKWHEMTILLGVPPSIEVPISTCKSMGHRTPPWDGRAHPPPHEILPRGVLRPALVNLNGLLLRFARDLGPVRRFEPEMSRVIYEWICISISINWNIYVYRYMYVWIYIYIYVYMNICLTWLYMV